MLGFIQRMTFKRKITLLVASAVAGLAVVTTASVLQARQLITEGRQAALHTAVQSAFSIVSGYKAMADAGQLPVDAAKKAAIQAVREARYGGADGRADYFYIFRPDGFGVMHPKNKKWEQNEQLVGTKNAYGVDTVKSMVDAINGSTTGAAYVTTMVARLADKAEKPVLYPKLQYMAKVPGWDWVVGSGLYMDDVDTLAFAATVKQLGLSLTVIVLIGGLGFGITRVVLRQLGGEPATAIGVMTQVAEGNLAVSVPAAPAGSLIDSLARMVASVRSTVTQVRSATESITTASSEIASGNQNLSARTEQTASNLQQAASSMEQLTGTVRQSADSARQANQLATSAAEVAQRGGTVVGQVVSTMEEINTSSKKISDIIGVIDGIAFQTNILALNAAVEAARAGEQGRGFAVVASEVRSLAQRSAEAAREIKALIGTSVDKVETGTKLVADAGATMQEIVSSVQRVSDIIGEITAASTEQSTGIGQVNTAVTQLDQMTQQNAALVEESAAAAESLKEQATKLWSVVATFKTDTTGAKALAAAAIRNAAAPAPVTAAAPAPRAVPAAPIAPRTASEPLKRPAPAPAAKATDEWESF